jgi:hypothetical protein
MVVHINESALRHGIIEADIHRALETVVFDGLLPQYANTRRKAAIMSDMTEQEAWELDELLTNTTPEVNSAVQGPFIKRRNMMVVLDHLSAEYLTAKMLAAKQSPAEIISSMIRRELSLTEAVPS